MKIMGLSPTTFFFLMIIVTSLVFDASNTPFGNVDFFQKHGVAFLVFITFFPRLTLLFSSVAFGGIIWWMGFFFCPRILVASLATTAYFHTNPNLVIISWVVALGGEFMEKKKISSSSPRFVFKSYRGMNTGPSYEAPTPGPAIKKDDAIEVEFTKK